MNILLISDGRYALPVYFKKDSERPAVSIETSSILYPDNSRAGPRKAKHAMPTAYPTKLFEKEFVGCSFSGGTGGGIRNHK